MRAYPVRHRYNQSMNYNQCSSLQRRFPIRKIAKGRCKDVPQQRTPRKMAATLRSCQLRSVEWPRRRASWVRCTPQQSCTDQQRRRVTAPIRAVENLEDSACTLGRPLRVVGLCEMLVVHECLREFIKVLLRASAPRLKRVHNNLQLLLLVGAS